MSEHLEALWLVERADGRTGRLSYKLFRTRQAARDYQATRQKRSGNRAAYKVRRATWGPES